jgi:hypothetical protein
MKKLFLIIFLGLALVLTPIAFAKTPELMATSSGEKTSDAQIRTGKAAITSVMLITDGTNAATITIHDGTSNAAKKIGEFKCDGSDYYAGWVWDVPVYMGTGIYVDVTGTGASYIIEYVEF